MIACMVSVLLLVRLHKRGRSTEGRNTSWQCSTMSSGERFEGDILDQVEVEVGCHRVGGLSKSVPLLLFQYANTRKTLSGTTQRRTRVVVDGVARSK